jgi:hypothetical protein
MEVDRRSASVHMMQIYAMQAGPMQTQGLFKLNGGQHPRIAIGMIGLLIKLKLYNQVQLSAIPF